MLVNWPQYGRRLKYFMRLAAIGFTYDGKLFGITGVGDLGYSATDQALCRGNLSSRSGKRISFLILQ
jgi:hypothetical protein